MCIILGWLRFVQIHWISPERWHDECPPFRNTFKEYIMLNSWQTPTKSDILSFSRSRCFLREVPKLTPHQLNISNIITPSRFSVLACKIICIFCFIGYGDLGELELLENLFEKNGYNKLIRPVSDPSKGIEVGFQIALSQIIHLVCLNIVFFKIIRGFFLTCCFPRYWFG